MFHFVDDNTDFLEFVAGLAEIEGHDVKTFASPLSYLEFVRSAAFVVPTALFTDMRMPEMNGFELLEKVREHVPEIRTAVITGYAEERSHDPYCLYLRKPVHPQTLLNVFQIFSSCHAGGPSNVATGCQESDNRGSFKIDCRDCPSVARERQNAG